MTQSPKVETHQGCENLLNDRLAITAVGEPGAGGAFIEYRISSLGDMNPEGKRAEVPGVSTVLKFQSGMPEDGKPINGGSNEALLAVIEHRLKGFQAGDFPCNENAEALRCVQEALQHLKRRSRRMVNNPPRRQAAQGI